MPKRKRKRKVAAKTAASAAVFRRSLSAAACLDSVKLHLPVQGVATIVTDYVEESVSWRCSLNPPLSYYTKQTSAITDNSLYEINQQGHVYRRSLLDDTRQEFVTHSCIHFAPECGIGISRRNNVFAVQHMHVCRVPPLDKHNGVLLPDGIFGPSSLIVQLSDDELYIAGMTPINQFRRYHLRYSTSTVTDLGELPPLYPYSVDQKVWMTSDMKQFGYRGTRASRIMRKDGGYSPLGHAHDFVAISRFWRISLHHNVLSLCSSDINGLALDHCTCPETATTFVRCHNWLLFATDEEHYLYALEVQDGVRFSRLHKITSIGDQVLDIQAHDKMAIIICRSRTVRVTLDIATEL